MASTAQTRTVATKIQARSIKQLFDAYASNKAKEAKRVWLHTKFPDTVKFQEAHEYVVADRTISSTTTETIVIEKDQKHLGSPLLCFVPLPARGRRCGDCLAFFGNNLKDVGGIHLQDSVRAVQLMVAEGRRLKEDAKILWDKVTDRFYFVYAFTQSVLPDPDPTFQQKRLVATDPGCYPFQAWYSPTSGCHGELLSGGTDELKYRLRKLEAMQDRIGKRKYDPVRQTWRTRKQYNHTTRRLKRKLARQRMRQGEWVRNAHYDAANFLLRNHDVIIQPILHVARLVSTENRNISKETVRVMNAWSHLKFRQRLRSTAFRYPGRHVLETEEPGTSKTCAHCGYWHSDLRVCDKVFCCPSCGIKVNRQTAGARNNFFAEYGKRVGIRWDGQSN